MIYRAIRGFFDLQDGGKEYKKGDTYPREGLSVLPSRIKELLSSENRLGEPVIEKVAEPKKKSK